MKKLALVLILTVSVLFSSTCWGEWTRVARSGSGQDIYYLDFEKIKERKGQQDTPLPLVEDFRKLGIRLGFDAAQADDPGEKSYAKLA